MSINKCFCFLLVLFFFGCGNKKTAEVITPQTKGGTSTEPVEVFPKNIILMIGDGMGIAQISASLYSHNRGFYMEQFPVVGLQKTFSGDNLITDSAAGATAMGCGVKTYNNAIGVDMDTLPVPSIMKIAKDNGLATGMVVTCSVTNATPAAFVAHNRHRDLNEQIALDFMDADFDLLIGGGKKFFDRRESDDRDLYKELKKKGYRVENYFDRDIFDIHFSSRDKNIFFTSDYKPVPAAGGRKYLPYMSSVGAKFLRKRSDKGFFMMIEGSQIDWGGHDRNAELILGEMKDFNAAIGRVLKFARKDGETLVIVTADHECGGFAINNGSTRKEIVPAFTSNGHTADLVPVFAFGPQSQLFNGVYDNTDLFKKMMHALQLKKPEKN